MNALQHATDAHVSARPVRRLRAVKDSAPIQSQASGGDAAAGKEPAAGKDSLRQDHAILESHMREMIAMVSHDLRTPLTSITGMLSLLRVGACGDLPPQALEAVSVAERGTHRLIKMINDLLDYEKLQSGTPILAPSKTSSSAIINRSVEAVIGLARQRNITISFPTESLAIYADEDRLVQVLVNLLSNALLYSPEGSVVTIAISQQGSQVQFSVADRGPGIRADQCGRLFQPFVQLETVRSDHLAGSGLGLAIAQSIVRAHAGEIGVNSTPGHGSKFWFVLPA